MDYLVHTANVLYLASYLMRDLIRLRILTVVAASCLIPYFYLQPRPLTAAICWNVFFIALNLGWIVRLIRERAFRVVEEPITLVQDPLTGARRTVPFSVSRMAA